jgi:(R,R)-butanediol dehydrogenase / meso-butanediol dehydrogenase / diacetyl reductase
MKALVYHGKKDLRLDEVNEPVCEEGQAIIKVSFCGICGSDLTIYEGKHVRAKPPLILGHEFSGVIAERKGSRLPDLKAGDRVIVEPTFSCEECDLCRSGSPHICLKKGLWGVDADGGFARFVKVSLKRIYKLPEAVSLEEGALVEPLAVALRGVAISRLAVGETAVVLGGGPIGLLTAQVARAAGAVNVIVVEPVSFRKEMAEKMGFPVLDPDAATREGVLRITGGKEIDVVFDAAGAAPAALLGTQLVRRTGRIVIIAVYKELVPYDLITLGYGEIQVFGSCIYTSSDFSRAIALVEKRRVDLAPLITHKFPLEQGLEAFKILLGREKTQKVLIEIS